MNCRKKKKLGRPSKRPDDELLLALYKDHTAKELAEMYDISPATVRSWVCRTEMEHKQKKSKPSKRPDAELLLSLYENHTANELAVMYDVTPDTVRSWVWKIKKERDLNE